MASVDIPSPVQHSIRGFHELLCAARAQALAIHPVPRMARQRDNTPHRHALSDNILRSRLSSRWTRETENPFDVATSACRDAIR